MSTSEKAQIAGVILGILLTGLVWGSAYNHAKTRDECHARTCERGAPVLLSDGCVCLELAK
ncbi:MAG: hypothetical protein ACHREM_04785 [Polyangiales bacterium]